MPTDNVIIHPRLPDDIESRLEALIPGWQNMTRRDALAAVKTINHRYRHWAIWALQRPSPRPPKVQTPATKQYVAAQKAKLSKEKQFKLTPKKQPSRKKAADTKDTKE